MKNLIVFLVLLISFNLNAQSDYQKFKKLSAPIKWWIVWHPFKAKRAQRISKETQRVADSVRKTNLLDGDHAGGQVDAFRHAYWMARLNQEIGKKAALSLGKAHEKDNYLTYKKRKLEDGVLPDEVSMKMDLFNNCIGVNLTKRGEKISRKNLINRIVTAILSGKMMIVKKDKNKNFLTRSGKVINPKDLRGKWKNAKCLVKSNN